LVFVISLVLAFGIYQQAIITAY